ncbi:hypothetical protein PILCRDRAFT_176133 [Piloderma croceum F 1598]|uniref:Uncharacterized protein n=1 Tax=Piloderma croceum (strain F 1598) TaxID=765440 RepID=A0A0C3GEX7_PILCF|nr:hypothetical protein PILCRDRAFT_176133 [Piloderma croceum F 1598]
MVRLATLLPHHLCFMTCMHSIFGLTDDYESSYTDLNQDCEDDSDDYCSDQSQKEVLEQLLIEHSPSPSPKLKSNTFPTTQISSTNMNQMFKRPHILDDSASHENRPFKIPRFLSPNSSMIHYVSPLTTRPTDSESALISQSLERPQDCTDHAICYHETLPFKSPPCEHPCKKSSTRSNETPGWIKFVGRVDPIDKSTSGEADNTADTANQSDSTLVGSTSEPNMSLFVFLGLEYRE